MGGGGSSGFRPSSAAGLFGSPLGVQLREPVGVLVGRQRPPVPRHLPQRVQAGAGEAREGEATRRIDDFDQAAFQQRADRGPVERGLALAGAGGPAVQPEAVVERVGLPAARPELRADRAALGSGERGARGVEVRARGTRGIGGGRLARRGPATLVEGSGGRRRLHRAARNRPGRGRWWRHGQRRIVGRHQHPLEVGAAQVSVRPGGMIAEGGDEARA